MCGISGIYAREITDQHIQLNQSIVNNQMARGPDHQDAIVIKGKLAQSVLGHNRLSIIDLSQHANQPMWDATHRYCIVYNGEIYNYVELRAVLQTFGLKFNTASDTEVILNAFAYWGIDALNHFLGPFAFAIVDTQTDQLWLCRDRFGIRPLYYTQLNDVLYFASTTPVLAKKLNLKPDLSYIAKGLNYLVYEDGSETTAYQNLFSLSAGSYLQAGFNDHGRLVTQIKQYYDLSHNVQTRIHDLMHKNTDYMLEQIEHKLEKAVQIRLRTDVPLAISLSGGLDSSSVAALVSKQHANTIGFSFSHPQEKQSEGPVVSQCAQFLNIQMQYVWPSHQEMINALYRTIDAQDAPFSSLSIVAQFLLYKQVRSAGVKVLLGGQGGDEAFMGYKKFLLFWLQQNLKQKRYMTAAHQFIQSIPMFMAEMGSLKSYWHHRHRYLQNKTQKHSVLRLPASPVLPVHHSSALLWKRQMQDITQFSLPTLLRYEDRNAMGNSVESRLPYMDHQLIELGLALPESIKLRKGYGKWGIRKIMQNQIPDQIRLARYKRGFDIPLAPLIHAGLGEAIRTTLRDNKALMNEFLKEPSQVDTIFSNQQLIERKSAIAEAISLLWLNKVSL